MTTRRRISAIILLFVSIIITIVVLFPIYYLIMASLQPSSEMFRTGMKFTWDSRIMGFKNYNLMVRYSKGAYLYWYKNSLLIATIYTVCSLCLSSFVGYGLGKYDFRFKNLIFVLVLVVMMIPLEILMLPLYKLITQIKLINTYGGIILPFVVSPTAVFFFMQFSSGLSSEFQDAGRVDGCTEIGIFFRIMAPLMKPAFGAMAILLAMQNWNSFLWPLIVLRTSTMFTLTIGLASLINPYGSEYDVLFPGAVVAIIPIVIVYVLNQKYFISGLTSGGVKG